MSSQRFAISETSGSSTDPLQLKIVPESGAAGAETESMDIRLLYISVSRYDKEWACNLHSHTFLELFYFTAGTGHFSCSGNIFPVSKNDLVIVNPALEHAEYSQAEQPLEYIVLGIEGLAFTPPAGCGGISDAIHISGCAGILEKYLHSLLEEVQNHASGYVQICQHLMNIVLLLILRHNDVHATITATKGISSFCVHVKTYLDNHYKEDITLDALAALACQSKYYMVHAFKEAFGQSPIKYQMNRRIEESMYLLTETDTPIADIGVMVGFPAASHFTQAFKRTTGVTPNQYRKDTKKRPPKQPC